MSQSQAELTLLINAKNLAAGVVGNFGKSLDGVGKAAGSMATKVGAGFKSVSSGVVNGLGNLTETLAQGGGLGPAAFAFGAYMAGQAAEALLENLIEKLAESTVVEVLGAALSSLGATLGSFLSSAIAIGAAAFPVVLAAVIIGAIVFLINNPDIVNKILDFGRSVIDWIVKGLATLGRMLLDLFGRAWQLVVDAVGAYVKLVADFWLGLPGKIAAIPGLLADVFRDAFGRVLDIAKTIVGKVVAVIGGIIDKVREALRWLGSLAGPMVGPPGHQIPNPNLQAPQTVIGGSAGGGATRAPVQIPVVIDGREVARIVDERLFYDYQRASPTPGRV